MSILFEHKDFESFFDLCNFDFRNAFTSWTHDWAEGDDEWNSVMIIFGFKTKNYLFNLNPEIEWLFLDLKTRFNLPKKYVFKPLIWINYIPNIEDNKYELKVYLTFDTECNKTFINSLPQWEKEKVLENEDKLLEYMTHNEECEIVGFRGNDELNENMRRLANLVYFQCNCMTIYEYLNEIPMLDSEINHKEMVKRTTRRLKRLHRQMIDYTLNKCVPHPKLFIKP